MAKTRTKGRACAGKLRHATRAGALAHRLRLILYRGAFGPSLDVYRCPAGCGGWHVGHREHRKRGAGRG